MTKLSHLTDAAQPKSQSGRLTAEEIAQKNGLSSYIMRTGEWIHDGRVIAAIDEALAQQKQEMERLRELLVTHGGYRAVSDIADQNAEAAEAEIQRMKAVLGEHVRCKRPVSVETAAALLTDVPAGGSK